MKGHYNNRIPLSYDFHALYCSFSSKLNISDLKSVLKIKSSLNFIKKFITQPRFHGLELLNDGGLIPYIIL